MKVARLGVYPLSGARRVECGSVEMYPMGPVSGEMSDRQFVCYDPSTMEVVRTKDKSGTDSLFRITAVVGAGALHLIGDSAQQGRTTNSYDIVADPDHAPAEITVREFKDDTPIWDLGDKISQHMSRLSGKDLRVGQKTDEWLMQGEYSARDRAMAPLHIVTMESILHLGNLMLGRDPSAVEADMLIAQTRAGLVVDLEGQFEGLDWPERIWMPGTLLVDEDGNAIEIIKPCKRCEVTGKDAEYGGKSVMPIPKYFKQMPQVEHEKSDGIIVPKPVLGVYAVPVPVNDSNFALRLDQELELIVA